MSRGPRRRPPPPEELELAERGHARRVGSAITSYLEERGFASIARFGEVQSRWVDAVGADVAGHCSPLRLDAGALVVEVDHQTWAAELELRSNALLAALAREVGHPVATMLKVRVRRSRDVE